MTPSRPYIMRALYEWIVDNSCTPYLLVDVNIMGVMVPQQYVKDGQIVLNISPGAVMDLNIGNEAVVFNGRFGGVATDIHVPVVAVLGIYARENGQGMVFDTEEQPHDPAPPDGGPQGPDKPGRRPSLTIVK
ncbi:MAG: ClpXP protease specificity-enhancing factor [Halieaceae bacterium]|jgi:stringent starvation protein B|nr:ClpXP protease specificity-enhancing factor [Halieaceae bacterium]